MGIGLGTIIKNGAKKDNRSQLSWCIKIGKLNYIKYLIKHNYDIFKEYESFDNALLVAIILGHLDIVKYFIEEQGTNININHNQALGYAAKNGHLDVVKYLVEEKNIEVTHELWIWGIQNYQKKNLESKDILKYLEKQYKENES